MKKPPDSRTWLSSRCRVTYLAFCCSLLSLMMPGAASATEVILDGNTVIRIEDLPVPDNFGFGGTYDVRFVYDTANELYGPDGNAGIWRTENEAFFALKQITDALNDNNPLPPSAGPNRTDRFFLAIEGEDGFFGAVGAENFGSWELCETDCSLGVTVLSGFGPYTYAEFTPSDDRPPPPDPESRVDLSGTVYTVQGEDPLGICAMVLASGRFQFSCDPNGPYELTDLPREEDDSVKRQVYASGFFPNIDVLPDSTTENVYMQPSGPCPDYNDPYTANEFPDSAGDRIDISGRVVIGNGNDPVCAMVLANGQFMFSCGGSGDYSLNIPLDAKGQYKLQVYASGFAPNVQTLDEFMTFNEVRMARASECN